MKQFLLFSFVAFAFLLGSRTSKAQLAAPTNVTATPSTINLGSSSNLNATSVGNQIKWYTAATGGSALTTVNSGVSYSVYPSESATYYAEAYGNATTALTLGVLNNVGCYGLFFDIATGSTPVSISGFTWASNSGGGIRSVSVYTKTGTYSGFETNPSSWTIHGTYNSSGTSNQNLDFTTAVTIPANTTYGFFIFLNDNTGDFLANGSASALVFSDTKITVTSGSTSSNYNLPFSKYNGYPGSFYTLKGSIKYSSGTTTTSATRTPVTVTVNQTPTDITLSASSVNENVAGNTTVGTLSTTDPDAGNTFSYSLVAGTGDTDNTSFNISGSALRITNSPDFEAKSSYSVRVRSTDQGGLYFEKALTITINDLNEEPTDISLTSSSISENQPIGTKVASLSSIPSSGIYSYSLVAGTGDTDNSSFSLKINSSEDQNSGLGNTEIGLFSGYGAIWQSFTAQSSGPLTKISLRTASGSATSYTIKLKVYSGEGIGGTFLGEATTLWSPASNYITWNFNGISVVSGQKYTFELTEWTFPDGYGISAWTDETHYTGGKLNYSGYSGYELTFVTVVGSSVDLVSAESFNYENKSSYSVRIKTTNTSNEYFEKAFTISINDIAEAPSATTTAATNVSATGVTLNGTINTNNSNTTVSFEYGKTTAYGSSIVADQSPVTGTISTAVSKAITGLSSAALYHYRMKAENAVGITYGSDQTFTTLATAPSITSTPTLTVPYGKPYSYSIEATTEGEMETTLTAPTNPAWLSFNAEGQNKATLFGSIPAGNYMVGVAGDNDGNMYAITLNGTTIYKIEPDGTTTLWRSGLSSGNVYALHVANGYIYIPRYQNSTQSITRVPLSNPSAVEETFASSIAGGILSLTDKDGWIYATDWNNTSIYRINETTKEKQLLLNSSNGIPTQGPFGLTFGNDGNLYIATWRTRSIVRYDGTRLLTGNPGTPTTVLSGLPGDVSSIRQDKSGNFYLSMYGGGVRKYTSDFSSFTSASSSASDDVWSLSLTASGTLVYSIYNTNNIYRLQTGALLSGTPAKSDVGDHAVVVRASNSVGFTDQAFTIKVIDNVGPVIADCTPANSATNVAFKPIVSLTFDEAVSLGTSGTLTFYNGATLLKSFDLSVPEEKAKIVLAANRLSLNVELTDNLPVNTIVSVGMSAGFVKDDHNNNFTGFTAASNTWRFTTINKNTQTINFPAIAAKTYGDATFTLGDAKTNRDLTVIYTAEDPAVVSISGNQATILKAGTSKITATQAGDGLNLAATPVEQTLIVGKATLSVTADAKTKTYGEANPTLTFQYSGWKNGETETVLDTQPTASTTVDLLTNVGTHTGAITVSGGADNNYAFNYVPASMEVTQAALTVTANPKTKVYGEANPALTFQYSGWKNGETETVLDTQPTASTTVDALTNAGTHPDAIVVSGGADNNYAFSYVPASMEVTQAALTVTANPKTKVYGEANPALTFQYSGWKNGETETVLDTQPTASTTVDASTNAGTYPDAIVVSGGADNNYTFSYVPASIEVTKARLTVTADNQTKAHGEANPALTFRYSGWKNGEETIDESPLISTTINATTSIGTYFDVILLSGGSDNNYLFDYVAGDFEVTGPRIAGDTNGDGKITAPELAGDKNGNGVIGGNEIAGDNDGNGVIEGSEIAGDTNGDGKIDSNEIAGDTNGDGKITAPELAGDMNGNGVIDENEIAGDKDGNGVIEGSEIAGDTNGDGKIDSNEIAGDSNGDGKISAPEILGDRNGNGLIDQGEIAGDRNGNGRIDSDETRVIDPARDHINVDHLFSPNGDGINDYWKLPEIEKLGRVYVKIYNRWGTLLYESTNYQNDWDGTSRGKAVPEGGYIYFIRTEKGQTKTGVVNLVR